MWISAGIVSQVDLPTPKRLLSIALTNTLASKAAVMAFIVAGQPRTANTTDFAGCVGLRADSAKVLNGKAQRGKSTSIKWSLTPKRV